MDFAAGRKAAGGVEVGRHTSAIPAIVVAMAYVIDGNNVIGQTPGWHRDKPGSRRRLLSEVAAYVAATKARVTVVFDGAPDDDVPDGGTFRGVRVYYPGRGSDADSVIERLVAADRNRRGIIVVTSD